MLPSCSLPQNGPYQWEIAINDEIQKRKSEDLLLHNLYCNAVHSQYRENLINASKLMELYTKDSVYHSFPKLDPLQLMTRLGLEVAQPPYSSISGLIVTHTDPSGPAWQSGIRPGARITHVFGVPVRTLRQFAQILSVFLPYHDLVLSVQDPARDHIPTPLQAVQPTTDFGVSRTVRIPAAFPAPDAGEPLARPFVSPCGTQGSHCADIWNPRRLTTSGRALGRTWVDLTLAAEEYVCRIVICSLQGRIA